MRYFTFRFVHSAHHIIRDFTIASTDERDALSAAWGCLAELADQHRAQVRLDWRLLSTVIRPIIDVADALAS